MVKPYSSPKFIKLCSIIILLMISRGDLHASLPKTRNLRDTTKISSAAVPKINDTRKEKPAFLKNKLKLGFAPFKPEAIKINKQAHSSLPGPKPQAFQEKVLTDVKIYPNPVGEQLNLNYFVSKDVNMTIKVMDFLGNEVTTLLSQRVRSGEQNNSFNVGAKLKSGMYFVRFVAANETVVKRISVL